jgi:rsbT antagonist protein RsbS
VDSHLCAAFGDLATAARYMGAQTVLCGLSPEIAITLQTMGFDLEGVRTVLTLEHAMTLLGIAPPASRSRSREREAAGRLADEMLRRNAPSTEAMVTTKESGS